MRLEHVENLSCINGSRILQFYEHLLRNYERSQGLLQISAIIREDFLCLQAGILEFVHLGCKKA